MEPKGEPVDNDNAHVLASDMPFQKGLILGTEMKALQKHNPE